jgi:uncharacterized membrane protein YphA (DoxX/SURF4 family)
MHVGFAIGRVIVGLYYLFSGLGGFLNLNMMTQYAGAKGVPAPGVAVIVSHLLLLLAAICILSGWKPTLGVVALVVFFLPVSFTMHAFWKVQDPMARMADMINFTKNMALMGSALMFLALPQPWRWSASAGYSAPAAPRGTV